jgi:hypothetical protein
MHAEVVAVAFFGALGLFAAWLAVMLRHERQHRVALVEQRHESRRSHRRAALAARGEPEPVATAPVVRPGSFCRVPGSIGRNKRGVALICEPSTTGRPRWRQWADRAHAA